MRCDGGSVGEQPEPAQQFRVLSYFDTIFGAFIYPNSATPPCQVTASCPGLYSCTCCTLLSSSIRTTVMCLLKYVHTPAVQVCSSMKHSRHAISTYILAFLTPRGLNGQHTRTHLWATWHTHVDSGMPPRGSTSCTGEVSWACVLRSWPTYRTILLSGHQPQGSRRSTGALIIGAA